MVYDLWQDDQSHVSTYSPGKNDHNNRENECAHLILFQCLIYIIYVGYKKITGDLHSAFWDIFPSNIGLSNIWFLMNTWPCQDHHEKGLEPVSELSRIEKRPSFTSHLLHFSENTCSRTYLTDSSRRLVITASFENTLPVPFQPCESTGKIQLSVFLWKACKQRVRYAVSGDNCPLEWKINMCDNCNGCRWKKERQHGIFFLHYLSMRNLRNPVALQDQVE